MLLNKPKGPSNVADLPVNDIFLACLTISIEDWSVSSKKGHGPTKFYSPSGLNCMRQMYYKRVGTPPDKEPKLYGDIGMSETGIARHDSIQKALISMNSQGKRFLYVDVDKYIEERQKRGQCSSLVITGHFGAETQILDKKRNIQFRCDGIIYDKLTHKFYLFEFKNQVSFKAAGKERVDKAHYNQVITYCALLELEAAFVVYENRDTCELYCPEVFNVSAYDKELLMARIDECEEYAKNTKVPPMPDNLGLSECKWCSYRKTCMYDAKHETLEANANG